MKERADASEAVVATAPIIFDSNRNALMATQFRGTLSQLMGVHEKIELTKLQKMLDYILKLPQISKKKLEDRAQCRYVPVNSDVNGEKTNNGLPMNLRLIALFGLTIVSACATVGTMLAGQLVNITDGTILPMEIETSYGTGSITAKNPKTGENLRGQYTGIRGADKFEVAQTKAILTGDKGTVLQIDMQIEPGIRPKGIGEAVDSYGNRYQVQF